MKTAKTTKSKAGLGIAVLLIMPLAIRVLLSIFMPANRVHSSTSINSLIQDPSFIAFLISGLITVFYLLNRFGCISELIRKPLLLFSVYVAIGTLFSILSESAVFGIFIAIEFYIYYLIAAICIHSIRSGNIRLMELLFDVMYLFLTVLLLVAFVDILLPNTQPFEFHYATGKRRFNGQIIPLQSIQWSAVSAVVFIISFIRVNDKKSRSVLSIVVLSISTVLLLLTSSRGAMLGVFVSILYLSYILDKKKQILIGLFIGVILALALVDSNELAIYVETALRLNDIDNLSSLGGRTKLWSEIVDFLISNPLTGYGIGIRDRTIGISGSLHNFVLESWLGGGVIGALFFMTGVILVGRILIKENLDFRKKKKESDIAILSAGGVYVYLITHGMTESNLAGVNNFFFLPFLHCIVVAQALYGKNKLPRSLSGLGDRREHGGKTRPVFLDFEAHSGPMQ